MASNQNKEKAADVATEATEATESKEARVRIRLPFVKDVLENNMIVILNGVKYSIPRGKNVEVPESVAMIIEHSEDDSASALEYIREQEEIADKASEALS